MWQWFQSDSWHGSGALAQNLNQKIRQNFSSGRWKHWLMNAP